MANVKDPQKPLSANLSVDEILATGATAKAGKPNPTVAQGKKGPAEPYEYKGDKSEFGFNFSMAALYRQWIEDNQRQQQQEDRPAFNKDSAKLFEEQMDEHFHSMTADEIIEKGILTAWDILNASKTDPKMATIKIAEVTDRETGTRHYVAGKVFDQQQARFNAQNFLDTQGIPGSSRKTTEFRVTTPAAVQADLVAAIDKASKVTGVPAALIGAMSGIESGFGKNLYSPTGAVGTFQQTGGYRDANWAKHGAFIAQHVPEARAAMADGLSKAEKKDLAFNNEAAAIMTALAAKEFAQKRGLDLNDKRTWGLVYAEHNSGAASVDRMMRGEMTDKFIRDCNPAVYRGINTPQEALAGFQKKIMAYASTYEKIQDRELAASSIPSMKKPEVVAAATGGSPKPGVHEGPKPVPA